MATTSTFTPVSITSLLSILRTSASQANPCDIASAVSHIFANELPTEETKLLLGELSTTKLEQRPDVLAACAGVMRAAAVAINTNNLKEAVRRNGIRCKVGSYTGGLCDIVGTGGDGHSTFNISTASSILASSLLLIAKHGNRASTSKAGSAEVLACTKTPKQPKLEAVTSETLPQIYEKTNYSFLFAPVFHPALKHVAPIRKLLPHPTIFNLLGPLTNPAEVAIEARVIGVKKHDLVEPFAEALKLGGAKKAMVVCGAEDLDEISCAGPTFCSRLVEGSGGVVRIEQFTISPEDFGLPVHPLSTVSPGLTPSENAAILMLLLNDSMAADDPILHFVLMNTASLFVISGVCDCEQSPFEDDEEVIQETGPGGGRWKEGVRLARMAISSGQALDMLRRFAEVTNELSDLTQSSISGTSSGINHLPLN